MKFPFFGASDDSIGTADTYQYIASGNAVDWNATENRRQIPLSEDVTLTDFKVLLDVAPGGVTTRTFTIRKNGADTAATVTITGAATSATFAGVVQFAAGDLISIKASATGAAAATTNIYWHGFMNTDGQKALLMGGCSADTSASAINYANLFGAAAWETTVTNPDIPCPTTGNITKLAVAVSAAPGVGKQYAFSLRLNGSSDVVTATVSGAATAATATGSQALAAADALVFKSAPTGTPAVTGVGWCFTFEPAVKGETIMGFGNSFALSTTATRWEQARGTGRGAYQATETGIFVKLPAVTIKNLYARISASPGGANSRVITWRDNGASSALVVTITAAATTGNDTTHSVTHTADQTADLQFSVTGTLNGSHAHVGYVIATTQPPEAAYGYAY